MANWCDNNLLLIHDDPEMITRAVQGFNEGNFLNEFIPVPAMLNKTTSPNKENADGMRQQYGYTDWYRFCINEWGTKWDVESENIDAIDENNIQVFFQSAWSPPVEAYRKLETIGFKIRAMYHEPGMAYCGIYEDTEDDYYDYSNMSAAETRDTIPQELDEMFNISEDMEQREEDDSNESNETA